MSLFFLPPLQWPARDLSLSAPALLRSRMCLCSWKIKLCSWRDVLQTCCEPSRHLQRAAEDQWQTDPAAHAVPTFLPNMPGGFQYSRGAQHSSTAPQIAGSPLLFSPPRCQQTQLSAFCTVPASGPQPGLAAAPQSCPAALAVCCGCQSRGVDNRLPGLWSQAECRVRAKALAWTSASRPSHTSQTSCPEEVARKRSLLDVTWQYQD